MQKFKKPVSILLVFMMIVSLFAAVPMTVNAAPPGGDGPGGIGTEIEIGSGAVGDFVSESEYLTFTAVENNSSVTLNVSTGSNLKYNKNNSDWQSYTVGSQIALENGETVRFRGKDTTFNYSNHVSIGGTVMCRGNVMSLRLDEDGRDQGLTANCFNYMFYNCTGLKTAPELPETTLADNCYNSMFNGCTSLIIAPELPATTLARSCYYSMFSGCESLIIAPELPATTLEPYCYSRMFYSCERLTTAPELPATTLEYGCYSAMFAGCESLITAPELPATALADNCYYNMFNGCSSLTTAPELPATTLATGCYSYMFAGCSSIKLSETETPEYSIPYSVPSGGDGTTAPSNALKNMFYGTGGTFTGTPEINKTYYLYREVPKYTVTWKNGDTTLETDTDVAEGTTPTYDGETPTKAADGDHMYVFSGWTPELAPVTEDVTYTATFASSANLVEITDHETDLGDLGIDEVMSEWGRSMTAQEAITLARYMSAQNDGAKCAVLYEVVDGYDLQYAMSDGTTGSRTSFYNYPLNEDDFLPDYKVYYLPVNLNPQTIELNLNQDNATVIWYDATDSDGYWSMEAAYNDSCYLVLKGNSDQPAGTYEWADMGSCEISDIDASQRIDFVDGSCTVTVDEDVVTVSGTFTGRDRNTYVVTVTYEAPYYTITDESVNGTVTAEVNGADVTKAKAGKTVLLNVAPADGYQLKSITASAQKTTPENFSDLVALMGDAVFDGDEDYNCAGYTCKVENGKFVVYNGTTLVTELSESNMTEFTPDTDYVEANSDNVEWTFFVENGEITEIDVADANADYDTIFSSVSGSKSTGTLQPVQLALTTVTEGSQYSLTMPKMPVTVTAEFEAIPTYTVTWKNGDTVLETDTDVAEGTTPTYNGEAPTKPDDEQNTYTFAAWDNGTTTYVLGVDDLPPVTGDVTYTAVFTATPKLFTGHSVTLGGDVGVNFFLNSDVLNTYSGTKTVKFTVDGKETTVDVPATATDNGYMVTCNVVAAQMAHKIKAVVYADGTALDQTDSYSVQDYAEEVYKDENKPEKLRALAKAMLNYGAMAQTVFYNSLKEHPALANKTVGYNDYEAVTAEQIGDAVKGTSADLNKVAEKLGAEYYTSSLIYLSKNTLRLYFTPASKTVGALDGKGFSDSLSGYYYYVDHKDIAAAELDEQKELTVGDYTFTYTALDYAKAVVNSGMGDDQKNLAKALYLYNKAANEYFDAAPAPVENVVDLSTLTGDYEAQNNDVLTGVLSGDKKISIAENATVTLKDANIAQDFSAESAGITLLGDATILLEGTNTVMGGYGDYPGIYVPANTTLTIDGDGSLTASGQENGCGIGGGYDIAAGNIVINGGTITATGGEFAAGIGSGNLASCGNITINGGTVAATGGSYGAGIGSGYGATCGNIMIADTVTQVTATKGEDAPNSIGAGYNGSCGTVTIAPGANVIQN